MPHRHYGVPIAKRRPTYSGPTRAAAWSGGATVGGIIATVIVLGFVVYEVSKIVAHASNTATSAPRATAEGSRALWKNEDGASMTVRGTDSTGSTPRNGHAYSGVAPAWSARAFVAIILAIVAIALVIWFALGG